MQITKERNPRFRRVKPPRFELTDDDKRIIREIHRHRFLRSTHIVDLLERPPKNLLRRLNLLYHGGFLDRPRAQIDYYLGGGSKPIAYGIGNLGVELLAREFGIHRDKVDWTAKNRSVKPLFIDHTLLIADVLVALERAAKARGNIRLIHPGEILAGAPETTRRAKNPYGWQVQVTHRGKRLPKGIVPDKIFGLHFLDEPEGRNRSYFFLEADRATMPVFRTDPRQTSIYGKLLAYNETRKQKIHSERYGIKNFRVLTVTTGKDRVAHMVETAGKIAGASGIFLFTSKGALTREDPFAHTWTNGNGQLVTIT